MASYGLVEVDSLQVKVIVDNEIDPISPTNNPAVQYTGLMQGVPLAPLKDAASHDRGDAIAELRMDHICCGAHGLSLMITAYKDGKSHTLLFDTGPEPTPFAQNASRLRAPLETIEHVHLSHWHRDHSGGLPTALKLIHDAKTSAKLADSPTVVDLHPARPDYRGFQLPTGAIVSLEADPTFAELGAVPGTVIEKHSDVHAVLDGFFLTSGEIPRQTGYELGIRGGMRFTAASNLWTSDEALMDERFVMCHVKNKGVVVFTGCSHAGVVNVCRHAVQLGKGEVPLYGVVGGFHLSDNHPEKLARSLEDLKALGPKVLMPGHCTGWKFKYMCEAAMPAVLAPSFCGTTYML